MSFLNFNNYGEQVNEEGEDFPIFISIYKIKQYFTTSISNVVLCLAFHQSMKTQMQWRISIYFNAEVTNRTDENVTMKKSNKGKNETNTNSNSIKVHTRKPIQSNWKHTKVLVLIKVKRDECIVLLDSHNQFEIVMMKLKKIFKV